MTIRSFVRRNTRDVIRAFVNTIRDLTPARRMRLAAEASHRAVAEDSLRDFALSSSASFGGMALVECTWDNPNFWYRYSLVRTALGLAKGREIGIVGRNRTDRCHRSCLNLGMAGTVSYPHLLNVAEKAEAYRRARQLVNSAKDPGDILAWELPHGVPADAIIYDGLLKRQRNAVVDLKHPDIEAHVAEALVEIESAARVLDLYRPNHVLVSHAANFFSASLGAIAAARGIPCTLLFGQFGVPRFVRLLQPTDIYDFMDKPDGEDLDNISSVKGETLAALGRAYLAKRLGGNCDDVGSRYAYACRTERIDRDGICRYFGFDPAKPLISVYAGNWFDFPHTCGMTQYRDFLDWLEVTVNAATANSDVNWLFKAHPCDDWYGGITLSDLMGHEPVAHVRQMPKSWNGADLINSLDGLVCFHSTAGIEFAANGKPVMVADRGWYHDTRFVLWPRTRQEYLDNLAREWWLHFDMKETRQRAEIFAGWYFGCPAWQSNLMLRDDSFGADLYVDIPHLLKADVDQEVATLRRWFSSTARRYHTFKMAEAETFAV